MKLKASFFLRGLLLICWTAILWSLFLIPEMLYPGRQWPGIPIQAGAFLGTSIIILSSTLILRCTIPSLIPYICRGVLFSITVIAFYHYFYPVQSISILLAALLLLLLALTLSFQARYSSVGLESFCLVVLSFFIFEACLQSLPPAALAKNIVHIPPLARPDRSIQFYQDNAFKGKKPCDACSTDTRIVTTGSSSTYGVPMFYSSAAYPSQLENLLHRRHPDQTFEVINAGIAGHGITQIFYALEHTLLALKPDIVTINCWFNDSSPGTGWYGIPNKSDREAFQYLYPLWVLQRQPWYEWIHQRRIYALFRLYLVEIKKLYQKGLMFPWQATSSPSKQKHRRSSHEEQRRLSPEEYEQTLDEIILRLKDAEVMPVLLFEPLHHSNAKQPAGLALQYFKAVERLATKHAVPFINPLPAFASHDEMILFHDFIHPNATGHTLLAETLYMGLINHQKTATFFHQAHEGTRLDTQAQDILPYSGESSLEMTIDLPYATQDIFIDLALDDHVLARGLRLHAGEQTISVPLPELEILPQYKLSIQSQIPTHAAGLFPGTSDALPAHIRVQSGGKPFGWHAAIAVNNEQVHIDSRGYTVVILDGESGRLLTRQVFDTPASKEEADALITFLESAVSKYPDAILALAVRTDGHAHLDRARLGAALQSFGGSGGTPESLESFALIGKNQLPKGSAFEATGPRFIELSTAKPELLMEALLHLKDARFIN